eukprot:7342688-Pyramimonas_sp.AAC.1
MLRRAPWAVARGRRALGRCASASDLWAPSRTRVDGPLRPADRSDRRGRTSRAFDWPRRHRDR